MRSVRELVSLFPRIRSGTPRIQHAINSFLKLIYHCQNITALNATNPAVYNEPLKRALPLIFFIKDHLIKSMTTLNSERDLTLNLR